MKVICSQCGKVLDLMESTSFAVQDAGQLKTYYFCTGEHMAGFAERKGLPLGKD